MHLGRQKKMTTFSITYWCGIMTFRLWMIRRCLFSPTTVIGIVSTPAKKSSTRRSGIFPIGKIVMWRSPLPFATIREPTISPSLPPTGGGRIWFGTMALIQKKFYEKTADFARICISMRTGQWKFGQGFLMPLIGGQRWMLLVRLATIPA